MTRPKVRKQPEAMDFKPAQDSRPKIIFAALLFAIIELLMVAGLNAAAYFTLR